MNCLNLPIRSLIAVASLTAGQAAWANGNTVFQLQGTPENAAGFDQNHTGPGANFFQGLGETGISYQAADLALGAHFPNFNAPWISPDGIVDWGYWDPSDGVAARGSQVVTRTGQVVYQNPTTSDFVVYNTDADAAGSGDNKLYYATNVQTINALSFGNYGTQPGASEDWQQAIVNEYDLQQAYDGGFTGSSLVSATFTIWIDDVINFGLTPSTSVELPSQAFVNTYSGDGDLKEFETVQAKFDLSDQSTAADTVDLLYDDGVSGPSRISRSLLARAFVFDGVERIRFDFDVTDEIATLIDQQADFAGIVLGSTSDGDFTLGSIDDVVRDASTNEVIGNFLPRLTLEFEEVQQLAGDANGDGMVSLADLDILGQNFGGPGDFGDGDFNGDGVISLADLDILGQNFGSGQAAANASPVAVPEPASLSLLGAGVLLLARRRRRNR